MSFVNPPRTSRRAKSYVNVGPSTLADAASGEAIYAPNMAFELALRGRLEITRRGISIDLWRAVRDVTNDLKSAQREDVRGSGIRRAATVATSWRSQMFPRDGSTGTLKPAGAVWNRWTPIVESFQGGKTIRPVTAGALLVPLPAAKRIARQRPFFTRADWFLTEVRKRYGRLTVRRLKKSGQLALGAFEPTAGGRMRFLPLFLLARQVRAPGLLQSTAIFQRFARESAARVQRAYDKHAATRRLSTERARAA